MGAGECGAGTTHAEPLCMYMLLSDVRSEIAFSQIFGSQDIFFGFGPYCPKFYAIVLLL